ncbi:MAG TPA: cytochrome c [Pyrinomonadaceae bacterium]|nr:cytochrome c [Pyrinomonadaceae bacterium]
MEKRGRFRLITIFLVGLTVLLVNGPKALTSNMAGPYPPSDGMALYGSKCAICHGKDGSGTAQWRGKGQPDLSSAEWQKSRSDSQIAERIRQGKGKMPPFGKKLSDEEVTALVKQVRNFRR